MLVTSPTVTSTDVRAIDAGDIFEIGDKVLVTKYMIEKRLFK